MRRYSSVYIKAKDYINEFIQPIIYQINYRTNGRLKSIYQYIDHKQQKNKRRFYYIPIWQLVLGLSYLTAILIILIAALLLTFTSPRPGLYQEKCGYRSCVKGFGLKCIDYKCQCNADQYYTKECKDKKSYMQTCNNQISVCQDNKGFVCKDGFCKCVDTEYWNGLKCIPKGKISSSCKDDSQCLTQLMLVCDTLRKRCVCNSTRFWDGNVCFLKKTNNEKCDLKEMCSNDQGLSCIYGVCSCDYSTQFWNGLRCQTKKPFGSPCVTSVECNNMGDVYCISFICKSCPINFYYNGTDCEATKEYNITCNSTSECYTPGLLSCKNGICDCPLPTSQRMYWVPEFKECRILPKNCKEIQQQNSTARSGIFYLASSVGLLEAYCEMEIDGGGYTFLPWTSLSASTDMLKDIFNDTSKILFRVISRINDTDQPYIITTQLPQYSNIPIQILENNFLGFTRPLNYNTGSYIFIGFLPASVAAFSGMTQGFTANGRNISFTNCDANPNSYFTLFSNTNGTSSYTAGATGSGMLDTWINSSLPHPLGSYMPSKYFFFTELCQGGCGIYTQSDRWINHFGTAFGMK